MKSLSIIVLLFVILNANAQFDNPNSRNQWNASWVTVPDAGEKSPGLYLFRKNLTIDTVPDSFNIYVSADNRYKLYVNEKLVSLGPVLGDIDHWNYEKVNLSPYLKARQNIVAAKVWNEGELKAVAQFSFRTGFIIQGANEATQILNTNISWKCIRDYSYTPIRQTVAGYYAAGAGDKVDMNYQVKGWEKLHFDDTNWPNAKPVFENSVSGFGFRTRSGWTMVPSILPPMEMQEQRLVKVRRSEGVSVSSTFLAEKTAVQIPANTTAKILVDQEVLTNAYPTLIFSGGKNSIITIAYAESLFDAKRVKNNRNEIDGKTISGRKDSIISNGANNQNFTTLSYRTYRYVELEVKTQDTPLTLEDFYGTFTGYPFSFNAKLDAGTPELNQILDIGWRTARLCAVETYMDCPYYERLQYIGDTRIQVLVSLYNSGDDKLAKNTLNLMNYSRQQDGYTLSRYPDTQNQVIPPYSLWYISMLYDYMMYGSDRKFIENKLLGERQILNYFINFQNPEGSLKNVPSWNFTDWVPKWRMGVAPVGKDGSSALMDLQLLMALQSAIKLEKYAGKPEFASLYGKLAEQLGKTIKVKYWDNSMKLFADTPEKDKYSQHANSLAILAGLVPEENIRSVGNKMLSDTTLAQASIYFKYYLHLALTKAGLGNEYLSWLDIWRKNIQLGLTTWGETSEVESTRSDCHAWGASPNIEFFRIILGIDSDSPGFSTLKIEPHLGALKKISGEMPHPTGKISVSYDLTGSVLKAEINLPQNTSGNFIWKGKTYKLKGGNNKLNI